MPRIPATVERTVVAKLYSQAESLEWSDLTPKKRSAQYDKWLEDPEIGGKLVQYLTPAAARVWVKDGPMKEWTRARNGVGKYASFVSGSSSVLQKIVRKALGEDWDIRPETLKVKPLRAVASCGGNEAVITWAPPNGLKHMIWAALAASASGDSRDWTVCVTETLTNPTPENERQWHRRLADRAGLKLVHVSV